MQYELHNASAIPRRRLGLLAASLALALLMGACGSAQVQPTATPLPTAESAPSAGAEAAARAQADLAQRLALPADTLQVVSVEPHTWPDASLGLPEPGRAYAQVLTEGYIVTLRHGGRTYVYHVAGSTVRFDTRASAPLPTPSPPLSAQLAQAGVLLPVLAPPQPPAGFRLARIQCEPAADPPHAWLEYRSDAPAALIRIQVSPDLAGIPPEISPAPEVLWARGRLLGVQASQGERRLAWNERGLRIELAASASVDLPALARLLDALTWQGRAAGPELRLQAPAPAAQVSGPLVVQGSLAEVLTATVQILLRGPDGRLLAQATAALNPSRHFEATLAVPDPAQPQSATLLVLARSQPAGRLLASEVRELSLVRSSEPVHLSISQPSSQTLATSPLTVTGSTGASLEPLRIRLVAEGIVLAEQLLPVQLASGSREGQFQAVLTFTPSIKDRQAQIEVYSGNAAGPAAVVSLALAGSQTPARVVILEPAASAEASLPLLIVGQTRTAQEQVQLRLSYGQGRILDQEVTTLAWGERGLFFANLGLPAGADDLPADGGPALLQAISADGGVLASCNLTLAGRDRREVVPIYLARPSGELVRAQRTVVAAQPPSEAQRLRAALEQLCAGPTAAERNQGLGSGLPGPLEIRVSALQIPAGSYRAKAGTVTLRDQAAEVYLSTEVLASPSPQTAHRQVVQTVRELSGRRVVDVFAGGILWNPEAAARRQIRLAAPEAGAALQGQVTIRGLATITSERRIRVRVIGADERIWLEEWVPVQGGELGTEGAFEATLSFPVPGPQTGRIEAQIINPDDGSMEAYHGVAVQLAARS